MADVASVIVTVGLISAVSGVVIWLQQHMRANTQAAAAVFQRRLESPAS